jgi:trk system potassium uptake protein TrkA
VKVLIVGCGRLGSRLASELDGEGHDVTVVDRDPAAFNRAAARGVFGPDFRGDFVVGDGCDAELLRRAGVEKSDSFIAVTEGDNRNIMAARRVSDIRPDPRGRLPQARLERILSDHRRRGNREANAEGEPLTCTR